MENKQMIRFVEKIRQLDATAISRSLKTVTKGYRPYDPGWYLYKKLNILRKTENIFSDDYLELVYVTLSSWNMNSRAARLADFERFKAIIRRNEHLIKDLGKYSLLSLSDEKLQEVLPKLEVLFYNLKGICLQNAKVVTISKTMHFLLPDLIVPIDRKYTISFFKNNIDIPHDIKKQFLLFKNIFISFVYLSQRHDLTKYAKDRWNENIPKVLDNIVIGYRRMNKD